MAPGASAGAVSRATLPGPPEEPAVGRVNVSPTSVDAGQKLRDQEVNPRQ